MESTLEQVKALAVSWLGPFYEPLSLMALAAFPFLAPTNLNAIFILTSVLIVLWYYLRMARANAEGTLRGFLLYLAPREVLLHRSAIVDYQYFIINSAFLAYLKLSASIYGLVAIFGIADGARSALRIAFGFHPANDEPTVLAMVLYTVAILLAVDFSRFLSHLLQHRIPVLWEFHKVHHSAQVLTPLTNYRVHPIDIVVDQFLASIAAGLVIGFFSYFYASGLTEIMVLDISILYFLFYIVSNLRHSHVPLQFGWRTSHVLCSPYMHHIHHSSEERHWDKNFSLVFSVWDTLFRTAYVPHAIETFRLGLPGDENRRFASVLALYISPFVGILRRLLPRVSSPAAGSKAE